jgi:hypothetical protein
MSKRYVWQNIDNNKVKPTSDDWWPIKKQRKKLATKFASHQQSGRYVHIMDDEMFNTILQMLESNTDIQMAKTIIWNSKINDEQVKILINKHCRILLNNDEDDK